MKKNTNNAFLSLLCCTILTMVVTMANTVQAQHARIDYFELNAHCIQDSSQYDIYYMLAVSGSEQVSNISIVVKNEQGQTIASLSSGIASLIANNAYRIENGVLYLTIETGAHALSTYYEATAVLTPINGEPLEYTRTKQM